MFIFSIYKKEKRIITSKGNKYEFLISKSRNIFSISATPVIKLANEIMIAKSVITERLEKITEIKLWKF